MDSMVIREIEKITEEYFTLLEDYFGTIYIPGLDVSLQAFRIEKYQLASKMLIASIEDLQKDLFNFWEKHADRMISFINNSNIFKTTYCGNISPLNHNGFINRTALYVDTILIKEPIGYLMFTKPISTDEAYIYNIIQHAFNLFELKKLFFGEGAIPLFIIIPPIFDEKGQNEIYGIAEEYGTQYVNNVLESDFNEREEIFEYLSSINDLETIKQLIKNPQLIDFRGMSVEDYLMEVHENISGTFQNGNDFSIGKTLAFKIFGQFSNISYELTHAIGLNSQIIFDRSDYWDLYKNHFIFKSDPDTLILESLQQSEFKWLINYDMEKFNILRNEEELVQLRNILRKNIYNANNALTSEKVKYQVLSNIEEAFLDHTFMIDEINSKLRKKLSVDGLVVTGAAVSGLIPASLALLPLISTVTASYGIFDFVHQFSRLNKEKKELKNGVMGMLFDARTKK
ncbi:hypothetical protein C7437_101510 [Psychrobacillus insolitus]|uniref:Uncharacterized protein n=1 Tax=Psychrobacillus insolitus TaxID=1461 RepID=A0A2W7MJR4_9BACI|nr:hypothetical protein [Psychrobacillus insolitus]PZX07397.1 hypothetical protein C7437_101510 [Psychrobacillus insolitus]